VTEGSVAGLAAVVGGRQILTRHPVVADGVVVVLPTRTPPVGVRPRHGVPRRLLTQKGAEHHSLRVLKLLIPTRRTVGERQVGARLLGHQTHTPLRTRQTRGRGQDGAAPRLVGEAPHPNRRRPLGMKVRPRRRVIMVGQARDQQVRQEDGAAKHRAGAHLPPLLGPRLPRRRQPLGDQDTDQQYTTHRHQPECLLIVLICLRKRQPRTRHTNEQGRQHSNWISSGSSTQPMRLTRLE